MRRPSIIIICVRRDGPGWIRCARAFHRPPKNPVQQILRALVHLVQTESGTGQRVAAQQRIGDFLRLRIHLVERNVVRHRSKRRVVGLVSKAIGHRRRRRVQEVHRRQSEYELDRSQEASLVVLRADDLAALRVRADYIGRCPIAADVVPTGLRIVLDREYTGLLPETAAADRLHNPPERQIVVGNVGSRCW